MNIVIIVKSLKLGGMEKASINLAELFAKEGHNSHLIYFEEKNRIFSPNDSVKLHLIDLENQFKKHPFYLLLKLSSKILNTFIRHSYSIWYGMHLTRIFKKEFSKIENKYDKFDLIIIRGHSTTEMIWNFNKPNLIVQQVNILTEKKIWLQNFYRRLVFSNKNVVCNSNAIFKELKRDFTLSNVTTRTLSVIPSPVNKELILKKSIEYPIGINQKYLINLGRLAPVKNISFLIDTYFYARKKLNLKHLLVIVGTGPSESSLKEQVNKLGLSQFVIFTGALENPYPWLKNADLFVFTSKNEGLPNVLLESLVCETNIVATKGRGGTLDIMSGDLENNLTDFKIQELADKIINTLDTKQTIAFDKHLQKYSGDSIVKEYLKFI